MTALAPKALAALLVQVGLTSRDVRMTLVAIALAETGGELGAVLPDGRVGPFAITPSERFARAELLTDAAYSARAAVEVSQWGATFTAWPSWTSGEHTAFLNAARQGDAQAAAVAGSILDDGGRYVPADPYTDKPVTASTEPGPGGPVPLSAALAQQRPLEGLRISGTELTGDLSSVVIGTPAYSAGLGEIPNLTFTIADPEGDLLWLQRNLWVRGASVTYLDLDLRIDEIKFEPGSHTTGQLTITAIDALVYALQQVRGARSDKSGLPHAFISQEIRLAGYDPARYFIGEALPSQGEIARDVPDANNSSGGDVPSAWTTILRLGKERGRRVFMCGRKLVFGSTAFAADWANPGDLRIGYHNAPEGARWLSLPTTSQTSQGSKQGVTQVSGRVTLERARHFLPGASVIVHNTPAVAAGDRRFVVSDVAFDLGRDTDGADITLTEPVELDPEKTT